MSEKASARRHIVCVDGAADANESLSKDSKLRNSTSISRIKSCVKTGLFEDESQKTEQILHYYEANTSGGKFGIKSFSPSPAEQQIQDIVLDVCKGLKSSTDEVFFFGSGVGAYVVRAVAGVLHHMGNPKPEYLNDFAELYKTTLELIKARQQEDSRKGVKAQEYLRARTDGNVNIRFMGIFDAVKSPAGKQLHDTSIISSIKHFRHALAFNENRSTNALDMPEIPGVKEMTSRSFVQAWFLGYHADLTGGTHDDGLSIYPLQWILIEAMLQGLAVGFDGPEKGSKSTENPLAILFPQYAGKAPQLGGNEKIQWTITYANDIVVTMFDPHSVHIAKNDSQEATHTLYFENVNPIYSAPRKIFNKDGLIGYDPGQTYGTIIHPSVVCILDRNQRYFEQKRFKPYKESIGNFEMNCMRTNFNAIPPWLEESQLLASGVKAFRILVCGKTGVGKSTLINKVFGVEMTEESNTYAQGKHDINEAFESPNHPGLLIHDSRGWQAGSDQELDLIAQFLRHRAFQKDPAEALHVIWFCVDSDVSRIEEADKRTFETIAQYSNNVPVFVVGTKKDKLVAFRKMQLLEEYMQKTNDYQESSRLADLEANRLAQQQFEKLRDQLSQIKSYKADGFVCLSKDDEAGVKSLLTQTLDMIVDDRVRLFCVAAQVVDVNQKIDSAISECIRLGTHAIRTAMVPLPFTGIVGTPTVSRIICEHVLQCFGFPKAMPTEVEDLMSRIVLGNLKQFLAVSLTHFVIVSSAAIGVGIATLGVGAVIGFVSPWLSAPPTARMLLKCSCDIILILERSFRYNGKYVSMKQIEDAAKQYVTITTTTFSGKEKLLQQHIRDEVDRLVPLTKIGVGLRFSKLRTGFEHIIYKNRFDRPPGYEENDPLADKVPELDAASARPTEMSSEGSERVEVAGMARQPRELADTSPSPYPDAAELPGSMVLDHSNTTSTVRGQGPLELSGVTSQVTNSPPVELSATRSVKGGNKLEKAKSDTAGFFARGLKTLKIKKSKSTT